MRLYSNIRPALTFSSVLEFTLPQRIIKPYLMTGLGATAYAHGKVVVDYSNHWQGIALVSLVLL